MKLLNIATAAVLLAMGGVSFAQYTGSTTPSGTQSQTPSVTPSQTQTIGGRSKCENLLIDRDKCLQEERAGTGSTSGRAAGAGDAQGPGSTGTGAGTMGPQNAAPSGTVR
jgi:hypothetical protein